MAPRLPKPLPPEPLLNVFELAVALDVAVVAVEDAVLAVFVVLGIAAELVEGVVLGVDDGLVITTSYITIKLRFINNSILL
jgi:hypothetical protein